MRTIISILLAWLFVTPLMGGSCDEDFPTMSQVELQIPDQLRRCPAWPKSPGLDATKGATARYIIAGYYAYKTCNSKHEDVDALYAKYRVRLQQVAKGK